MNANDGRLYKFDINGETIELVLDNLVQNLISHDGRLYYADLFDHGYIWSMNSDGGDRRLIIGDNGDYMQQTDYITYGIDR